MKYHHRVITPAMEEAMRERNAKRVEIIKRSMGDKHLLHPANRVLRKDVSRAAHIKFVVIKNIGEDFFSMLAGSKPQNCVVTRL